MVAGYLFLVDRGVTPPPKPLLILVLLAAILFTGYQAVQRLRDLLSGGALVREDLLNSSYAARGGNRRGTYYGRFENPRNPAPAPESPPPEFARPALSRHLQPGLQGSSGRSSRRNCAPELAHAS